MLSGHLLPLILGHLLPLFWDICSPLFRTFALRTFALRHLLPPILGHLLSVTKADLDSASITKEVDTIIKEVDTIAKEVTTIAKEVATITKEVATVTKVVATIAKEVATITKEDTTMDDLNKICQQYFDRWYSLEGEIFFLQQCEVILRDLQLTISVIDMEDKFIKHILKYENKLAKMQEKAVKLAFANQLQFNQFTISVSNIKGNFIKPILTSTRTRKSTRSRHTESFWPK